MKNKKILENSFALYKAFSIMVHNHEVETVINAAEILIAEGIAKIKKNNAGEKKLKQSIYKEIDKLIPIFKEYQSSNNS